MASILRQVVISNPLLLPACSVLGAAMGVFIDPIYALICIFAGLTTCLFRQWKEAVLCFVLGAICCGQALSHQNKWTKQYEQLIAHEGKTVTLEGSVIRAFSKSIWLQTNNASMKYEIIPPDGIKPGLGEQWIFTGITSKSANKTMPGAFDREQWLFKNGVTGRLITNNASFQGKGNNWSRFLASSEHCRSWVADVLRRGSPPGDRSSNVMVSILLGDKSGMSDDMYQEFRKSGSLHIFAVSGLHIGIISVLILSVLLLFGISPVRARITVIPLLACYVYVIGMPVSAMRAFVMITILFMAMSIRRRTHFMNTLSLTLIIFLLWNPVQLMDAGFQLSFGIYTVITLAAVWQKERTAFIAPDSLIPKSIYNKREKTLVRTERWIRYTIVLSICCWIAALPITLMHFGTFNLYSALTNTLMMPFVPILMGCCILSLAFSWSIPCLLLFNYIGRWLANILLFISGIISSFPAALVPSIAPASLSSYMVISHSDGVCTVVLGNPGLMINGGSAPGARYSVSPALMSEGFAPKGHILTKDQKKLKEGMGELAALLPNMVQTGSVSSLKSTLVLPYPDGRIVIYPPPEEAPYGVMDDHASVIRWEYQHASLLYIGDASYHQIRLLPEQIMKADILIIGQHSKDPMDQVEWIHETGAETVIFTHGCPDAVMQKINARVNVIRMKSNFCLVDSLGIL